MIARLFESPDGLHWLGLGLLALFGALAITAWGHERRRQRWLGEGSGLASVLPDTALLLTAACIGIALCGPLLGERRVRVDDAGMDVVLLVDASRSMDARDTPPSRLRRARETGTALIDALAPGDRVALVAFGGSGRRLAPLTPDRDVLARLLERVDSRTALPHGSSLQAGLATALETFELDAARRRAIVLLSDGELPAAGPAELAALTARHGVHVFAALFGHDVGATILDHGVPLIGPNGEPALTRRETVQVEALAGATGGRIFLADRWGRVPAGELVAAVRGELGDVDGAGGGDDAAVFEMRRVPTTLPFALAAFVLLLVEAPLRDRLAAQRRATRERPEETARESARAPRPGHSTRRRVAARVAGAALLAGLGASAPGSGDTRGIDGIAAELLRAGSRAVARGDDDAAFDAFRAAAATALRPDVAGTAHYQLGVWHLKHEDPLAARDAFLESLRLDPLEIDAVFNLEWSLLAIEARREAEDDARPPLLPRPPDEAEDESVRDETSTEDEPKDEADRSPEHPRTHAPEHRSSGLVQPRTEGIPTTGPNRDAGASGRPLPDDETLSWWLDLVEDDPGRAQQPDRARGRGPKRGGPPW